jgi:hypothetical protein
MAKAMDACTAGKITGLDVARCESYLNRGLDVPAPSRTRCSRLTPATPRQRKRDYHAESFNILPNVAGSQTVSGEMSGDAVAELQKALSAGYGSDVASLQGGGALRIQSLEKTMLTTIQENQHFVLFNELAKSNATATVDEWTEQNDVGGFLGGSTNTETGNIAAATGNYQRRVGLVKYLMTRREVSFVQTLQNTIADSEATEARNGALQLLTDAEFLCFEGDSSIVPTEYDGIYAQMVSLRAEPTTSSTPLVARSTRSIWSTRPLRRSQVSATSVARPTCSARSWCSRTSTPTSTRPSASASPGSRRRRSSALPSRASAPAGATSRTARTSSSATSASSSRSRSTSRLLRRCQRRLAPTISVAPAASGGHGGQQVRRRPRGQLLLSGHRPQRRWSVDRRRFGAGHGCRRAEGHLHAHSLGGCAGDRLRDLPQPQERHERCHGFPSHEAGRGARARPRWSPTRTSTFRGPRRPTSST